MADVRTTITMRDEVYAGVKARYRALGFSRMADLVNEAVREYLQRCVNEENDRKMEAAAANPAYRALLRNISDDFAAVDAEGIGPDY